jgi:beta-galactosidase beta subunit
LEVHRDYIDIHILLEGKEHIEGPYILSLSVK